jgi:hypothetical protein
LGQASSGRVDWLAILMGLEQRAFVSNR